ncbi:hypothetical protein NK6_5732 [Bradyrhizobium diazoefficiens]|uniref:Uncharacterized protein n=1 Tax=Bradyrhizobium diazoefficiens TaxID=1355477 RepID=A0A0E4BRF5_9BRAD|nr:hypothetical protein NK6_5732 [Bradyrhizobium diazoefficiens]
MKWAFLSGAFGESVLPREYATRDILDASSPVRDR